MSSRKQQKGCHIKNDMRGKKKNQSCRTDKKKLRKNTTTTLICLRFMWKLQVQNGTVDKKKLNEYVHSDYIISKELIKIRIWFDRKWDSSP